MQFPKLTPLQSRFAASLLASAVLVFLYFTLSNSQFAYAAEIDSILPSDHNHPIIIFDDEDFGFTDEFDDDSTRDDQYEPGFPLLDRSIIGRASAGVTALANNDAAQMNIEIGETQNYVFPKEALAGNLSAATPGLPSTVDRRAVLSGLHTDLRKRQDIPGGSRTLYITMNVCLQPSSNSSSGPVIPPQLQVYISQSADDDTPGPGVTSSAQHPVTVTGGFASVTVDADDDVYIGVSAPNTTDFTGIWNYELAGSIDAPFHSLDGETNLYLIDSDNNAALLVTDNLTQADADSEVYKEWMDLTPPFSMFAINQNDSAVLGVQNSYCGLQSYAQVTASESNNVEGEVSMTNRGLGSKPKQQFYIRDLNSSSTYFGFLAMAGNSTASGNGIVGGGGKVWQVMNFTTKQGKIPFPLPKTHTHEPLAEDSCALIFDLPFCSEVAYAVPSNPAFNMTSLASLYDDYASTYWTAFNYSLQQIQCNATNSAQYSLARNCDDCAASYKTWLCAVTIPRCEDFGSDLPYLMPRNTAQNFLNGTSYASIAGENSSLLRSVATNSSRNPMIDTDIKPGPYKEVLPCKDLCWDIVQSCPAALGFSCPLPGKGLDMSYGSRSDDGDVTCSYLGEVYYLSAARRNFILISRPILFWVMIAGTFAWTII